MQEPVQIFHVVHETWLTRKPQERALVVALAATLLLVLGSFISWRDWLGLSSWMSASFQSLFLDHQYWRAWTTLFVHGDEKHLLSNAFLFFVLAYFLAGYFSLLVFPFAALFFGGVINFLVLKTMPAMTGLIGMSGVVYWMGGVWLILYFFLETRKSLFQRALRSIGVALALFMPAEAFNPEISYQSHLFGFLLGAAFGGIYYFFKRREFLAAEVSEDIVEEYDDIFEEKKIVQEMNPSEFTVH